MNRVTILTVALLTVTIQFVGGQVAEVQDVEPLLGNTENGEQLFTEYTCSGCHGYTGETGLGTRLNPPRMRQARFIQYLRNPTDPERMPPYQEPEVSDQNLADIYAFLESLPSQSPAIEDIPLLQAILRELRR
jgi:mono/diheme cytochrome c family protein